MTATLAMAALDYVTAGLHVLALIRKKPNGYVHGDSWSWDDSFYGVPADEDEWESFERAFSESSGTTGIAILIPPGFYVADVDTDRAAQLLLDLGFVANDETVAAQTKNGIHVWFYHPEADRNRWVGDGQEPNPGRTLLFKGLGGYVVAPPSLHFGANGRVDGTYSWIGDLVANHMMQMPDILPSGAAQRFKADSMYDAAKPEKKAMTYFNVSPGSAGSAGDGPWWTWPVEMVYATEGLERAIETAAEGQQNNVIHWSAMTCREEGVPLEVAMERLMDAAERGNHPRNRARDTIRGAYRRAERARK